jgi:hypothetical protein
MGPKLYSNIAAEICIGVDREYEAWRHKTYFRNVPDVQQQLLSLIFTQEILPQRPE